ncbi:putative aldose 1-/Glucose-6-phosphate 1-epimerase, galactose mutarotase-like domain superfamily [Helianthus annuus]|uniref:Aldose 1-/Glucose-6-phosphate 1-epimerase, galactose mutarotase-like domain superfamily n=1 Tax=Helianthus annuus TaxID=4232 RepID=A0A9K3N1C8_HELAN|nr:putative aldose 1-/Glucose-6-phosphate 1-epimerase, galactose mutarotase-like domain superfamily [Helianthus annuus]KAJ0522192.1 putative aldose 1-/Glucose-6-phosphate 1-epimerase, galactose mutarotase-like domain superfamily [Helianthus annuus]KAJ0876410.1 putative aldose 1-/Glucose-6-phosphate 1-epimerase, galactose mutarotase-like domain superfamily [Helianthus annuus]
MLYGATCLFANDFADLSCGSALLEVHVEGLQTLDYFDNMSKRERYTEQADTITFDGEIDRVYLSTPTKITIIDHEKKRTIVLRKEGMVDAGWSSSSEGCNKGDIMDL